MYIMVKQLSKAKPTKKRHKLNCQKVPEKAVETPVLCQLVFVLNGLIALKLTSNESNQVASS